jgi:heat shock protein HslJ
MKNALILMLGFFALSCSKKETPSLYDDVQGSWRISSIINSEGGQSDVSAAQGNFVLTFQSNSKIDLLGPCNTGSGTYLLSENGGISFNDLGITKLFCDITKNGFEVNVLEALTKAYNLEKIGNELRISSNSNNNLVLKRN